MKRCKRESQMSKIMFAWCPRGTSVVFLEVEQKVGLDMRFSSITKLFCLGIKQVATWPNKLEKS